MVKILDVVTGLRPTGWSADSGTNRTRVNASGVIETLNVGERVDFDPITHAPRGILCEVQDTNQFVNSGNAGLAFTDNFNVAVAANVSGVVAPDGSQSFTSLVATSDNTFHLLDAPLPALDGSPVHLEMFIKNKGANTSFIFQLLKNDSTRYASLQIDAASGASLGAVGVGYTINEYAIEPYQNGVRRVSFVVTPVAGDICIWRLQLTGPGYTGTYPGDGTEGFYIWGGVHSGAEGSYIPTTSIPVTRTADALSFILGDHATAYTITFDDGSTQTFSGLTPGSIITIDPATLNRPRIAKISENSVIAVEPLSLSLIPPDITAPAARNISAAVATIALAAIAIALPSTINIAPAPAPFAFTMGAIEPPNLAKTIAIDYATLALTAGAITAPAATRIGVDHTGLDLLLGHANLGPEPIEDGLVPCWDYTAAPPSTADSESLPTADILLPAQIARTPRGPAWRTDEMNDPTLSSYQHRFWRAVCEGMSDLYRKAWQLTLESTAPTIDVDALGDWEVEYGLPDPCLYPEVVPTPKRFENLRMKVAQKKGQTIQYLVCLAASIGYEIAIEEPQWFQVDDEIFADDPTGHHAINYQAGDNPLVSTLPIYFECGVSGVEDFLLDFPRRIPSWFIVHVYGASGWFFEIDKSQIGDALADFLADSDLECVIRRDAPAHTVPIFDYTGLPFPDRAPLTFPINVDRMLLTLTPHVTINHDNTISVDMVSIALTLQHFIDDRTLLPEPAALSLTIGSVSVPAAATIAIDHTSLSLTAGDITVAVPPITIDHATLALTASSIAMPTVVNFTIDTAELSLTAGDVLVFRGGTFDVDYTTLSLTAEAIAAPAQRNTSVDSDPLTLTAGDVATPNIESDAFPLPVLF